ncbi:hypothetical protein Q4544_04850 [Cognatishimia sp. 1_MG-2023]|uniref:hypothetical protein n=1 Tax=Cognatishimia sp. 1_MG-2023 TaxID=3062642 RepID=UPI0026E32328|nr:hypothetical protein [Cognatishimia sp. 1_MG-2023]MDO6726257.1 hypothetical protein [Cognatishimia sp. 1_MG-2023]
MYDTTIEEKTNTGLEKIICKTIAVEEQAAGILGVEISHAIRSRLALYDSDRSYLEVFSTDDGGYLVVSSNSLCFDAAYRPFLDVGISHGYDERAENRLIAKEAKIVAPQDLYSEYKRQEVAGTLSSERSRDFVDVFPEDPMNEAQLIEEIAEARALWEQEVDDPASEASGLSVNRTVTEDGYSWDVSFSEDDSMTIILDTGAEALSDQKLADMVVFCWDEEWDDVD